MFNLIITLLIIAVSFYLGIIYLNSSILMVGYVLIILVLASVAELIYRNFTVQFQLEIPVSMVERGKPLDATVKIKNQSGLPVGRVQIRAKVISSLHGRGQRKWIELPGAASYMNYRSFQVLLEEAGYYSVKVDKIRLYSLTGMVYRNLRLKDEEEFMILPDIQAMAVEISGATRNLRGNPDVPDDYRTGADLAESYEIREYRPKDKLQNVHWKLSAKSEALMVKEIHQPKPCGIVLMLDSRTNGDKNIPINGFLKVAASISFSIMDDKCPHFVTWISKETDGVKRIRVDDEESFYQFLYYSIQDMNGNTQKDIRQEYREQYRNEVYVHDVCVTTNLEVYRDGELMKKWNKKNVEEECEQLELVL